jgi:uncharacterized protein (TIGR00297 family)
MSKKYTILYYYFYLCIILFITPIDGIKFSSFSQKIWNFRNPNLYHLKLYLEQNDVFTNMPETYPEILNSYVASRSPIPSFTFRRLLEALALNGLPSIFLNIRKNYRSLTPSGLLHATFLGIALWSLLGVSGWSYCFAYLVLGSVVTKIRMAEKEVSQSNFQMHVLFIYIAYCHQKLGIAEKRHGSRGPENVWGSAATVSNQLLLHSYSETYTNLSCKALIAALGAIIFPEQSDIFMLAFVSSLATKLSDTFASELGKAYGKTTYLITTLSRVPRGTEGAISLEGTVSGILGSLIMVSLAYFLNLIQTPRQILISIVSAFLATTIESYIGAAFQSKFSVFTNEFVNFIMTIISACISTILYLYCNGNDQSYCN